MTTEVVESKEPDLVSNKITKQDSNSSNNANKSSDSKKRLVNKNKTKHQPSDVIRQSTTSVFMVPPCKASAFNAETAKDNNFMEYDPSLTVDIIQKEWNGLYDMLTKELGISVIIPEISGYDLNTPDCLFPNNWISTEQVTKNIIVYPMKAKTRRMEVRDDIIDQIANYYNYDASNVLDLREMGFKNNIYLEGTGVMVLDHLNKLAYCSLSQRCDAAMVLHWCNLFGFGYIMFESYLNNATIYHTNVMMAIGSTWAVVALDCIKGEISKKIVKNAILQSGKDLIEITGKQVESFCGNVLELKINHKNIVSNDNNNNNNNNNNEDDDTKKYKKAIVMSERAYKAFTKEQKEKFVKKHKLKIFQTNVDHIESALGGGVRCMICELF